MEPKKLKICVILLPILLPRANSISEEDENNRIQKTINLASPSIRVERSAKVVVPIAAVTLNAISKLFSTAVGATTFKLAFLKAGAFIGASVLAQKVANWWEGKEPQPQLTREDWENKIREVLREMINKAEMKNNYKRFN